MAYQSGPAISGAGADGVGTTSFGAEMGLDMGFRSESMAFAVAWADRSAIR